MRIVLTSNDNGAPPFEFQAERMPIVIGSGPEAHVQLEGAGISGRHCQLLEFDHLVVASNLDSASDVLINGMPMHIAVLRSGDLITLGSRTLKITFEFAVVEKV